MGPTVFHQSAQTLEARVGVESVKPRSGLSTGGRCFDQGLDLLIAETGTAIACHVAANDTFLQARLEWLIDHAAVFEILDASLKKFIQWQLLRSFLSGIKHAQHRPVA